MQTLFAKGGKHIIMMISHSTKMVNPISKTSDVITEIETIISSTLPLDTTIQANKLTSGTEYERILEILNLTLLIWNYIQIR